MKFHSLRSLLTAVTTLAAALLLGSCGGGGAGGNPNQGGAIVLSPAGENVTLYAGQPVTFQLSGGRPPYSLASGDMGILPLPTTVDGHFVTVIPNNPGVIDAGIQPGELPVRTISIDLRDSTGAFLRSIVTVAQNFMTGYGPIYTPTTCPPDITADIPAQACAGGETNVLLQATFNGSLAGNRQFRFERLQGNFQFRHYTTGLSGNTVTTISDHTGSAQVKIDVPTGAVTHLGAFRVIDVATGVYAEHVFTIIGLSQSQNIVAIPDNFTLGGALSTQCGTGRATFFVFDGVPPYHAETTFPQGIRFINDTSNSQPGVITFEAYNPNFCMEPGSIVVTDARGGRATVEVTTEVGDEDPPAPPAFSVGPTSLAVGCGQSGSVLAVGGTNNYITASTRPDIVTAAVLGNTISISRAGPAGPGAGTLAVPIAISDGTQVIQVNVTVPATCP